MPSIVPGFEYDIFISYRQNDNRSGWVTEFVKALEEELSATIKEPVSVYFDFNPHDGLLETYNVDKSLEGKLKCLIFIPIVSQTYCDSKSFAWQQEFCAFNKLAKEDSFGSDIKLHNGNVASRILPIKIHDLDADDKTTLENEMGGVLRAIEFIYKSSGVNRPLISSDKKEDNASKTVYRDQLNKVANAVKEIVTAIKHPVAPSAINKPVSTTSPKNRKPLIAVAAVIVLLAVAGYFFYPKLISGSTDGTVLDKSIAVLPFVNMSNDPEQEYFSDGISEEVLNLLAKVPELKVIGRTSSFYFKGKNEDLRMIGKKLGAAHLLEGSVRRDGDQIRITAQLIRAEDGVHLWSDTYDRKLEKIFDLQDEIAAAVLTELKLKLLGPAPSRVVNAEVFNLMMKGSYFLEQRETEKAYHFYAQALSLDSANARIWASLAAINILQANNSYNHFSERIGKARVMAQKALEVDNQSSEGHRGAALIAMWYDFDWILAELEFKQSLTLEPGNSNAMRNYGQLKRALGQYQESYDLSLKSLDINPLNVVTLATHSEALINLGRFDEVIQILQSALELNPGYINPRLLSIYLLSGKYDLARQLLDKIPRDQQAIWAPLVWFATGDSDKMRIAEKEILQQHKNGLISSHDVAVMYAFTKRNDLALDYLEKAVDEKFKMLYIKSSLFFKPLHQHPRFKDILKRMNLPLD